ncbi:MAG: hypothetical protein H7X78_07935 [Methyloceanibacter sp.]|nr:hypothetical protein [Methyloceanibacter sp.]
MGRIEAKKDTAHQCWARLRLESGEKILISVAQSGVKIFKLKWGGLVPGVTLWASRSLVEVGEKFFDSDKPFQRPLDSIIDRLMDCRSAADVCAHLSETNSGLQKDPSVQAKARTPLGAEADSRSEMDWDARSRILNDYGDHLQRDPVAGTICDVKRLPHPKETILLAICEQIAVEDNPERMVGLVMSAPMLADYQEGVGDEPLWGIGIDPGEGAKLDPLELAKLVANSPNRQRYEAFRPLVEADYARIMSVVYEMKEQRDKSK